MGWSGTIGSVNAVRLLPSGDEAWLVEGESDCWVLFTYGVIGIGVPGGNAMDRVNGAGLNRFLRLNIVQENVSASTAITFPDGAAAFSQRLAASLRRSGYRNALYIVTPAAGFQDVSDIHVCGTGFVDALNEMRSHAQEI